MGFVKPPDTFNFDEPNTPRRWARWEKQFGTYFVAAELESCDGRQISVYFKLITNDPIWYNVISIIDNFGIDVCEALSFFHAFTGCDTVSCFYDKGKLTAWITANTAPNLAIWETFSQLSMQPDNVSEFHMEAIEKFTIVAKTAL